MTGLVALDVFIGLVFIYLLYSLFATAILEIIISATGLRARNLEWTIERMLSDDPKLPLGKNLDLWNTKVVSGGWRLLYSIIRIFYRWRTGLIKNFFNQPDIKFLSEGGFSNKPSYIKPETFSRAVVGALKDFEEDGKNGLEILDSGSKVASDTWKHLGSFWEEASGDVTKFRSLLEDWFDGMNDRAKGWYKRKTQLWLLVIGMGIAIGAGVDSIAIAKRLAKDDNAREQMIKLAESRMKSAQNAKDSSQLADAYEDLKKDLSNDLDSASLILGLGWEKGREVLCNSCENGGLKGMLGYFITAIAISLGSPFWFDLLNKLMKLRSSVPQPTSNQSEGSGQAPTKGSSGTGNDVVPARKRKG